MDINTKTAKELKEELRRRGLSTKGRKAELLTRLENVLLEAEEVASNVSYASMESARTILSQMAAETVMATEAAKKAELKARAALLDKKQMLLLEEMELKMKKVRLDLEEDMAVAEAREQAVASQAGSSDISSSRESVDTQERYADCVPASRNQEEMTAIKSLLTQQKRSLLPQSQLPYFGGDPLEYRSFIRAFDCRIANRTDDFSERMNFLEPC